MNEKTDLITDECRTAASGGTLRKTQLFINVSRNSLFLRAHSLRFDWKISEKYK